MQVVKEGHFTIPSWWGLPHDISPDGQRFLMIKDNASGDQASTPASMVVVLNWAEELKTKAPVGK